MTAMDWTVLEVDGVMDVCSRAARKVSTAYEHTLEFEDALQEAYIRVASRGDLIECVTDSELGLGVLHHRLCSDLVDMVKTEAGHRIDHVSHEREMEGHE